MKKTRLSLCHSVRNLILCGLLASCAAAARGQTIESLTANAGTFQLGQTISGSFTAKGPWAPTPFRVLLEGTDIYGNQVVIRLDGGNIPALQGAGPNQAVETATINFNGAVPNDGTLHNLNPGAYAVRVYTGPVTALTAGAFQGQVTGFFIDVTPDLSIPPVTYDAELKERVGGVLYKPGKYYGGDIMIFRTTIRNGPAGDGSRQTRPMRTTTSDAYRLRTVLSIDPKYQGTAGFDDFLLNEEAIAGDMARRAEPLTTIRSIRTFRTPPPLPTWGVAVDLGVPAIAPAPAPVSGSLPPGTINFVPPIGSGYSATNPPLVAIAGGAGSGALAVATVDPVTTGISAITIVNGGAGYTSTPTLTIAPPVFGARYYAPQPDNGFLDIGEEVELEYEVLVPDNYAAAYDYFVAAQVDAISEINEPTGFQPPRETPPRDAAGANGNNNTFVSDVADRVTILSNPSPTTYIASQITDPAGNGLIQANGHSSTPSMDADGNYVAFASAATDLLVPQSDAALANLASRRAGLTTPTGVPLLSQIPANEVPSLIEPYLTNGKQQIYRRNLKTKEIELASVASNGAQAEADCLNPRITPDARFTVFESGASNLVPNDTGLSSDIFVRDHNLFRTARVSVNAKGVQGNAGSVQPGISEDGRFVVFASEATNLDPDYDVPGNTPTMQVYVHDRDVSGLGTYDVAGNIATYLVSVGTDDLPANNNCDEPRISLDGNWVVFASTAKNLRAKSGETKSVGDDGSRGLIYRIRLTEGVPDPATMEVVSVAENGDYPTFEGTPVRSANPAVNEDGTQIAFATLADNLVNDDTNEVFDVFVRNLRDESNKKTVRISQSYDRVAVGRIDFNTVALASALNPVNTPAEDDSVTISSLDADNPEGPLKGVTFIFKTDASAFPDTSSTYHVTIGANGSQARDNLVAAINRAGDNRDLDAVAFVTTPANINQFYAPTSTVPGTALAPGLGVVSRVQGRNGNVPIVVLSASGVLSARGMDLGGTQADSDAGYIDGVPLGSDQPSIDRSGRVIAFRSTSQTLSVFRRTVNGLNGIIPGEILRMLVNGYGNVYVHNRSIDGNTDANGAVIFDEPGNFESVRASLNRFGYPTNALENIESSAASSTPSISPGQPGSEGGRYIAMTTVSENIGGMAFGPTNFDVQDYNGFTDVFVRDFNTQSEPPPIDPNQPPSVRILEPTWLGSTGTSLVTGTRRNLSSGSKIYIAALASDADGALPHDAVEFFVNGTLLTDTERYGDYWTASWTADSGTGPVTVQARVRDSDGATTVAPSLNFNVVDIIPAPINVTMLPLNIGQVPRVGEQTTIRARVTFPTASLLYSGAVVFFYANRTPIASVQVPAGATSLVVETPWFPVSDGTVKLSAIAATYDFFFATANPQTYATLVSNEVGTTVVGLPPNPPAGSNEAFVIDSYNQLLGRDPTFAEYSFYLQALQKGSLTRPQIVLQILQGAEYANLQNRIFDFFYRLGVTPTEVTYKDALAVLADPANAANTTLLPLNTYPPFSGPNPPFGATLAQAAVAQAIIDSPAFLNAWPMNPPDQFPVDESLTGLQIRRDLSNRDFLDRFFYPRMGGQVGDPFPVLAMMDTFTPPPQAKGSAVAFLTAMYPNIGLLNSQVAAEQVAYQYQLWATSFQWLQDGIWETPTETPVTNESELLAFISGLLTPAPAPRPAVGYDSWATSAGLSTEQLQAGANPSGDGISNMLKYAFNMDPNEEYTGVAQTMVPVLDEVSLFSGGNAGLPYVGKDSSGRMVVQFVRRRNADNVVRYEVQFSSDLNSGWQTTDAVEQVETLDATWERVTVRDTANNPKHRFGRVKVTDLTP